MKHVPLRTCIVCKEHKDKSQLMRIVRKSDGTFALDPSGKESGRGAYVCRNGECMRDAFKKRALNKAYKEQISEQVYEDLLREFEKHCGNSDGK